MPSKSKCRLCGGDVFNADISGGIITCVRCGQQYSMGAGKKEQLQPQPQRSTQTFPMTDTSSPSDFKIAFGVLKKYTGNSNHVVIPEGVTEIAAPDVYNRVFDHSLESIVLPKSLKVIGYQAFESTHIKKIDVPYGVSKIDRDAFRDCSDLKYVSLPSTLTEIGDNAFQKCKSLLSVEIPASVVCIGSDAFEDCTSLQKVVFNFGLETIKEGAFHNCTSLSQVIIPDSVVSLTSSPSTYHYHSFYGCYMLTQINYPSRFSPVVFSGTAWYDHIGKAQYEMEQRNKKISNGICPDCGGKLGMFNKCKRCGKKF